MNPNFGLRNTKDATAGMKIFKEACSLFEKNLITQKYVNCDGMFNMIKLNLF